METGVLVGLGSGGRVGVKVGAGTVAVADGSGWVKKLTAVAVGAGASVGAGGGAVALQAARLMTNDSGKIVMIWGSFITLLYFVKRKA
jgi:hypothetical protein